MGKQHVVGGLLASVFVCALFAGDAVAEEDTVGVTVAVAVNVTELEADLLSDELGKALSTRFEVSVISGEGARAKLPPEGLPETCIAETGCLGQTAAALGVNKLILLVAVRTGDDIQVDATLYDSTTKTSNSRPTVRMTDKRSAWSETFAGAADSLLPGAKVREAGTGGTGTGTGGNGMGSGTGGMDDGGGLRPAHYVMIGGAGVLAVGLGFGLAANLQCDDGFRKGCPEDRTTTQIVADATMGTGLVILLVGGAMYLFGPDGSTPSEQPAVGVVAGPGDVGLAIGGSF